MVLAYTILKKHTSTFDAPCIIVKCKSTFVCKAEFIFLYWVDKDKKPA